MAGRQAKILHDQQINDLLVFASATRNPLRNKVMVLLSVKAGLRAGEIAGLTWDMVLDPTGEVSQAIELHDCVAKKNSGRRIPLHPDLQIALTAWCLLTGGAGPVIRSERGDVMTPNGIVNRRLDMPQPAAATAPLPLSAWIGATWASCSRPLRRHSPS
jgi:integrase